MSQLNINYTPQITSSVLNSSPFICHRICYRQGISGVYCCLEDDTDSISGTPKVFSITISDAPCGSVPDVDTDSCTDTVYTGYVQACCESESSLSGRVDFTATFIADPSCINKIVCCISQRVLEDSYLVITDPGSGYDNGLSPLTVLVVRDVSDPVTPGGANDAVIEATIAGGVITALTVITPGLYGITPLLVIPSPTNPGTTASAIAVIPCADLRYRGNCNTSPQIVEDEQLLLGECANMCLPDDFPFIYSAADLSGVPDTANYSYAPGGCCDCTTCRSYTIVTGSALATVDLCYASCSPGDNGELTCITVTGSGSTDIDCVVPGSIFSVDDPGAILSITDNGSCPGCII